MNCFVENCNEAPVGAVIIGPVCEKHRYMLPQGYRMICIQCGMESCGHLAKEQSNKKTEDGQPETLGISVGENIRTGEAM